MSWGLWEFFLQPNKEDNRLPFSTLATNNRGHCTQFRFNTTHWSPDTDLRCSPTTAYPPLVCIHTSSASILNVSLTLSRCLFSMPERCAPDGRLFCERQHGVSSTHNNRHSSSSHLSALLSWHGIFWNASFYYFLVFLKIKWRVKLLPNTQLPTYLLITPQLLLGS